MSSFEDVRVQLTAPVFRALYPSLGRLADENQDTFKGVSDDDKLMDHPLRMRYLLARVVIAALLIIFLVSMKGKKDDVSKITKAKNVWKRAALHPPNFGAGERYTYHLE